MSVSPELWDLLVWAIGATAAGWLSLLSYLGRALVRRVETLEEKIVARVEYERSMDRLYQELRQLRSDIQAGDREARARLDKIIDAVGPTGGAVSKR